MGYFRCLTSFVTMQIIKLISKYTASKGKMIYERQLREDLQGSGLRLFVVTARYLPTERNQEDLN
jgi:hypothetical protein